MTIESHARAAAEELCRHTKDTAYACRVVSVFSRHMAAAVMQTRMEMEDVLHSVKQGLADQLATAISERDAALARCAAIQAHEDAGTSEMQAAIDRAEAERDAAYADCAAIEMGLEWKGDGYEWNPKNGDYRERPTDAIARGASAIKARLAAAEAERDSIKSEHAALASAISGITGALIDAGTISVPMDAMADKSAAIRQLAAERDRLAAENEELKDGLLKTLAVHGATLAAANIEQLGGRGPDCV